MRSLLRRRRARVAGGDSVQRALGSILYWNPALFWLPIETAEGLSWVLIDFVLVYRTVLTAGRTDRCLEQVRIIEHWEYTAGGLALSSLSLSLCACVRVCVSDPLSVCL
eukprot:COSAG03_NODE_322_length_8987_cov_10.806321_6_plen_109_part_00